LAQELESLRANESEKTQALESARAEVEALRKHLEEQEAEVSNAKSRGAEQEKALAAAQAEMEALRRQTEAKQASEDELTQALDALRAEASEKTGTIDAARKEVEALKRELSGKDAQLVKAKTMATKGKPLDRGSPLVTVSAVVGILALIGILGYAVYAITGALQQPPGPAPGALDGAQAQGFHLRFPSDRSLGNILVREDDDAPWRPHQEAQGIVTIPTGHTVRLEMTDPGAENLGAVASARHPAMVAISVPDARVSPARLRPLLEMTGLEEIALPGLPEDDLFANELAAAHPNARLVLGAASGVVRFDQMHPPAERTLTLPAQSIGAVFMREWGAPLDTPWSRLAEARGVVQIPARREIKIEVDYEAGADLSALAALTPLDIQGLGLVGSHLTDAQLAHCSGLTGLRSLRIVMAPNVGDGGLEAMRNMLGLEELDLEGIRASDAAFEVVTRFRRLRKLTVVNVPLTNQSLSSLRELRGLETLHVEGTRIGRPRLDLLRQDLPNTDIRY